MQQNNPHENSAGIERKLRLFVLAIIPVFIIWGYVMNQIQPESYDPIEIRLFLGLFAIVGLSYSYFVKNPVPYLNWLLLTFAYVITTHCYSLLIVNQFAGFSGGSIMILGIILQAMPSRKTSMIYVGFNLTFIAFATFLHFDSYQRELLFALSSLGILLPGLLFKQYYFQIVDYLRSSEAEKRTILESMSNGLILQGMDSKLISVNSAAARILEIDKSELIGKLPPAHYWRFLDESGSGIKLDQLPSQIAIRTGLSVQNILVGLENNLTKEVKWVNCSSVPLFDEKNPKIVKSTITSFQDVTDLKQAQNEIINNQMNLATASKLTSLGEMASGIAHEVNNPLAIIQGKVFQVSKILKSEGKLEPVQEHLSKIDETIFRIQKIIRGLRAFSRQAENDPFESACLKTIIADTMDLCGQKLAKSNIVVTIDLEPELKLDCRPGQISQILMNLLQNSSEAISECEFKRIDIKAYGKDSKIILKVFDSGPGIAPHIQQKIMQPFFTTKEVGKGTGLGLSISMGIAKQHYGSLYLDATSYRTCFVLELPADQNKNIDDFQVA